MTAQVITPASDFKPYGAWDRLSAGEIERIAAQMRAGKRPDEYVLASMTSVTLNAPGFVRVIRSRTAAEFAGFADLLDTDR